MSAIFFESDPEISLSLKQGGLSVTLTVQREAKGRLVLNLPDEESTEGHRRVFCAAVPAVVQRLSELVCEGHSQFQEALDVANLRGVQTYYQSSKPNV